jgi:uncharacterized protein (DUF2236 family)
MTVTREELERDLEALRREVRDPSAGLFGPDSMSWLVNREMIVFLAGGRAALLQLAHPYVAHAIDQHSTTRTDPLGRFQRTFDNVFAMAFGDLDHAIASARRVHAVHSRISGYVRERVGPYDETSRYEANDEEALMWVHATLIDSAVRAFELVVRRLSDDERERYYAESKRFAKLFGIPSKVVPEDWSAFQQYNASMWRWLAVGKPAREMGRFLLSEPALRPRMFASWYRMMTTGLLPEPLRDAFGLRYGRRERLRFATSMRATKAAYRLLPQRLRWVPAYADARRRLSGKPGRDWLGSMTERIILQTTLAGGAESARK